MMKTLKRCLSLLLAIMLLAGVSVFPVMAETAEKPLYTYIADSMSFDYVDRFRLLDSINVYPRQVAAAFDWDLYEYCALPNQRTTDAYAFLSEDYMGDDYTKEHLSSYLSPSAKAEYTQKIIDSEVISVQIGYNALTQYFVGDLLAFFTAGEFGYSSDFAQIFTEKERAAILPFASKCAELIETMIGKETEAALAQYFSSLSNAQKEALTGLLGEETVAALTDGTNAVKGIMNATVYTLAGHLIHFDRLIARIRELNPDAEIYVMGLVNPLDDLKLGFRVGEKEYGIDVGSVLKIVYDLLNSYTRVFSPYSTEYYYVENCAKLETFGDVMMRDEDLCRRMLYDIHNGSRNGYGDPESAAYQRADAQVAGVMAALNNTALIELDKLIATIPSDMPDFGSLVTNRPVTMVNMMEELDENGEPTAPYFYQVMLRIAFLQGLYSMFVHPTQAAHDAEAQILIKAMQEKKIDPMAKAYHALVSPMENLKKALDSCSCVDNLLAWAKNLSQNAPAAEVGAVSGPVLPLLSTAPVSAVKTLTNSVWCVVGSISHSILRLCGFGR